MRRVMLRGIAALMTLAVAGTVLLAALNLRDEEAMPDDAPAFSPSPAQIARGEYLARAGNCAGCHTARGGAPFAGGRPITTPFGTIHSTNITPDVKTGIGTWTSGHFWRALHNGRSRGGRLLYPAFPYTEYTIVTREDADAMYAYLRSLAPVEQRARPHELRFPYNSQAALAVWRALFFEPRSFEPDTSKSREWNRGAYLVGGLGHCAACHSGRNVFGATTDLELSGGLIPTMGWYAPSLLSPDEAGVGHWPNEEVVALLKTGISRQASTLGPMGEVVYRSTQFLSDQDLAAMAAYLKALPAAPIPRGEQPPERSGATKAQGPGNLKVHAAGAKLYETHCLQCHGRQGEGVDGIYPALARNRAVLLPVPANVIRTVLSGGYLPATAGNPRPFGMPPFTHVLSDTEIAMVVSYVRGAWGNDADGVSQLDVQRYRTGQSR